MHSQLPIQTLLPQVDFVLYQTRAPSFLGYAAIDGNLLEANGICVERMGGQPKDNQRHILLVRWQKDLA